jgi:hypothetical protein
VAHLHGHPCCLFEREALRHHDDKIPSYQTVWDVIWLALTDKKENPPVNQSRKVLKEESEEEERSKKEKRW